MVEVRIARLLVLITLCAFIIIRDRIGRVFILVIKKDSMKYTHVQRQRRVARAKRKKSNPRGFVSYKGKLWPTNVPF